MADPAGETEAPDLRVNFDRRLKLEFHGSVITSDAGLLAFRELDDALGLSDAAGQVLADSRTGKNGRHSLMAQFRQSVFGRLAGYEDVNDADRLGHDPAMRWVVGGRAVSGQAASTSQMGRFETEVLTREANLAALTDLSGQWINTVHARRPTNVVVLDMDSSVSPTHGEQESTAYNGHFGCTCYHPLFVFNQFGDLERASLRPGNVHSADGWREVLNRWWRAIGPEPSDGSSGAMPPLRFPICTTSWRPSATSTPSASGRTWFSKATSPTRSSARSTVHPSMSSASTPASAAKPDHGAANGE